MRESGIVLGGEQVGHVIRRRYATTGDGILTALGAMALMVRSGSSLGEPADVWQRVPRVQRDIPVDDQAVLERNPAVLDQARAERDALGTAGKMIVRMSTIEPVLRIICEAPDQETADGAVGRVADVLAAAGSER